MLDTEQGKAQFLRRQADKLFLMADRLSKGHSVQVSNLRPILGLLREPKEIPAYVLHLLLLTKEHLRSPLNPAVEMPVSKKIYLLDKLAILFRTCCFPPAWALAADIELIEQYRSGSKRVSVHASRTKYADGDIGLIDTLLRGLTDYSRHAASTSFDVSAVTACRATQFFCCDYKNYRFIPTWEYAERVRKVARYFSQRWQLHPELNPA